MIGCWTVAMVTRWDDMMVRWPGDVTSGYDETGRWHDEKMTFIGDGVGMPSQARTVARRRHWHGEGGRTARAVARRGCLDGARRHRPGHQKIKRFQKNDQFNKFVCLCVILLYQPI